MIDFSEFCYDGAQRSTETTETSSNYFSKSVNKDNKKRTKENAKKPNKDTEDYLKPSEEVSDITSQSNIISDSNIVSNVDSSDEADSSFIKDYNDCSDSNVGSSYVGSTNSFETDTTVKSHVESKNKISEDPRHPMFRYTLPRGHNRNIIEEFMFVPPPPK